MAMQNDTLLSFSWPSLSFEEASLYPQSREICGISPKLCEMVLPLMIYNLREIYENRSAQKPNGQSVLRAHSTRQKVMSIPF